MQVIGYCRVSTDEQVEGASLDAQETAIRAWAKAGGHDVVDMLRESVCGAEDIDGRPVLMEALALMSTTGPDARLVVWKRNRLARSTYVACAIDRATGDRVISLEMGDLEGPEAILMRSILDGFAAYERAQIILRTGLGKKARLAAGKWPGGTLPWGLCCNADGTIRYDAILAPSIVGAFRSYANGISQVAIAQCMPRREGNMPWTPRQVSRMLAARHWYELAGLELGGDNA